MTRHSFFFGNNKSIEIFLYGWSFAYVVTLKCVPKVDMVAVVVGGSFSGGWIKESH